MRTTLLGLCIALLATGCAHTVVIDSEPPGAEVALDGNVIGQTPVSFTDHASMKRTYEVTLKRDGYRARREILTQQFTGIAVCCPVFVPVGWQLPEDRYLWKLDADDGAPQQIPGMIAP